MSLSDELISFQAGDEGEVEEKDSEAVETPGELSEQTATATAGEDDPGLDDDAGGEDPLALSDPEVEDEDPEDIEEDEKHTGSKERFLARLGAKNQVILKKDAELTKQGDQIRDLESRVSELSEAQVDLSDLYPDVPEPARMSHLHDDLSYLRLIETHSEDPTVQATIRKLIQWRKDGDDGAAPVSLRTQDKPKADDQNPLEERIQKRLDASTRMMADSVMQEVGVVSALQKQIREYVVTELREHDDVDRDAILGAIKAKMKIEDWTPDFVRGNTGAKAKPKSKPPTGSRSGVRPGQASARKSPEKKSDDEPKSAYDAARSRSTLFASLVEQAGGDVDLSR